MKKLDMLLIGLLTGLLTIPAIGLQPVLNGTWDCGKLGKLTLRSRVIRLVKKRKKKKKKKARKGKSIVKVTGDYHYTSNGRNIKGQMKGTLKNNVFSASWRQKTSSKAGRVQFNVQGNELKGKWKKMGELKWHKTPWNCKK